MPSGPIVVSVLTRPGTGPTLVWVELTSLNLLLFLVGAAAVGALFGWAWMLTARAGDAGLIDRLSRQNDELRAERDAALAQVTTLRASAQEPSIENEVIRRELAAAREQAAVGDRLREELAERIERAEQAEVAAAELAIELEAARRAPGRLTMDLTSDEPISRVGRAPQIDQSVVGLEAELASMRAIAAQVPLLRRRLAEYEAAPTPAPPDPDTVIDLRAPDGVPPLR